MLETLPDTTDYIANMKTRKAYMEDRNHWNIGVSNPSVKRVFHQVQLILHIRGTCLSTCKFPFLFFTIKNKKGRKSQEIRTFHLIKVDFGLKE